MLPYLSKQLERVNQVSIQSNDYTFKFNSMLEEHIRKDQDTERAKNALVNLRVVRLLQQKTIPLNRNRYEHLQKISKALCKETPAAYTSAIQLTLGLQSSVSQHYKLPSFAKARSSRNSPIAAADLLINRLKNIKDLKSSSQLLLKDQQTGHCWEALRSSILDSGKVSKSMSKEPSQKRVKLSQNGKRKREDLLELAERAQKYLRLKKHDLKERYCQQEEYMQNRRKKSKRQTQIEVLLTTFKSLKKQGRATDEQLQRQLLKDIRETMLEDRINRMKKDINHKKIVQMR